jgi:hypothetical protein
MGRKIPKPWTEYDIEQLKTLVGKRSPAQIAVTLDRTKGAIIQKAFDLRLSLKVRPEDLAQPPTKRPAQIILFPLRWGRFFDLSFRSKGPFLASRGM